MAHRRHTVGEGNRVDATSPGRRVRPCAPISV